MKKLNLLLLLLLVTFFTFSQEYKRKTPEEKAQKFTAEMTAEINLDKDQAEKVYIINVDVSKKFDSLYASKPDKDLLRKGIIEIIKSRDILYRQILTNEQFLRFDDIQREKREKKQKEKAEKEKLELEKSTIKN